MTTACLRSIPSEPTGPADHLPLPPLPRRGQRRALTAAQERTIVARYAAGESTHQLARAFGVSQSAICNVLYRSGHSPRDGGQRRLTAEQEQRLAQQYAAGRSQRQLADEFGVSHGTVRNVLRRQSTDSRPARPCLFTADQERDVATRYRAGESVVSLAASFAVSTIRATLHRTGEPVRPAPRLAVPVDAVPTLVAQYRAGTTIRTLAARYEISKSTVFSVLEREGVARRAACRPPAASPQQAAAIAADHRAGASIRALAIRYGIGYSSVVIALDCHDVARRPAPGRHSAA